MRRLLAVAIAVAVGLGCAGCGGGDKPFKIGLIIKQDTNPFFREIRETTERLARRDGLDLQVLVGHSDVDNRSQVLAIGSMVRSGTKGILITPVDARGVVPAARDARKEGVTVIALDTPTEPVSAVNALFATDNRRAGRLIGRYARARAAELGIVPKIAMLDGAPSISSGVLRHEGFLEAFGLDESDPRIAAKADTEGNEVKARRAMARILRDNPDVNVVYTINEPAAFGAAAALRAAGREPAGVILVSVDGGCDAIRRGVRRGVIDATAQQYPKRMAQAGVGALNAVARGRRTPAGYTDTGVELITAAPTPGVKSRDVAFGMANCWG